MRTAAEPSRGDRSPRIAAFLSFLWPGLGQWYGRRSRAAVLFAVPMVGVAIVLLAQALRGPAYLAAMLLSPSSALTIVILIGLLAVWRILAIVDSLSIRGVHATTRPGRTLGTIVFLGALVLVTHTLAAYTAWAFYDASSRIFVGDGSPEQSARASDPPGATPQPSDDYVAGPIETPSTETGRINILLTGVDSAESRQSALTDTLLVASIDPTTGDVVLISIPRDVSDFELYDGRTFRGKINGFMTWVTNHPDEFEDRPLTALIKQVGFMLGNPIHYYAAIDLAGFRRMIDLVGGVTIDNPKVIDDPRYDWLDGRRGFYLAAGKHRLDGDTALAYVRSRQGTGDNDFTRARRQQEVLLALREVVTDPARLDTLPALLDAAGDTIRTNFPSDRIAEMLELAQSVEDDDIRRYVLGPTKYADRPPYSETGGIYKLRLKMDAVARLSIELFGASSRYASPPEDRDSPAPSP